MEGDAGAARSAETLLRARLDAQVARDRHRDRLRVIDADTRRAEEEARAADAKVALARDVLRDLERARDDARRRHAELAARRELAEVAARDAAGALAERDAALLRAGVSPARPVAVDDHDPSPSAPPWTESPSDFADWSASDDPAEPLRGGARTIPIPDVRGGVSPTSFTSSRRRAGGETPAWNLRRLRASVDATRLGGASRRETSADDPNPDVPKVPKPTTPRRVPPEQLVCAGHGANPPPTTTATGSRTFHSCGSRREISADDDVVWTVTARALRRRRRSRASRVRRNDARRVARRPSRLCGRRGRRSREGQTHGQIGGGDVARADGGVRDLDGVRAAFASDDCADGGASRPRRRA